MRRNGECQPVSTRACDRTGPSSFTCTQQTQQTQLCPGPTQVITKGRWQHALAEPRWQSHPGMPPHPPFLTCWGKSIQLPATSCLNYIKLYPLPSVRAHRLPVIRHTTSQVQAPTCEPTSGTTAGSRSGHGPGSMKRRSSNFMGCRKEWGTSGMGGSCSLALG